MLDLPPPQPVIEFVVASQGMAKGIRQTEGPQAVLRPQLQIGQLSTGLYLKNITSTSAEGEAGIFVGYFAQLGAVRVSPVISYKRLVDTRGRPDADAWEFGLSVLPPPIGPVTPYISLYYSPDELGSTGESLYAEAGASLRLSPTISASASLARRARAAGPDYAALSAGINVRAARQISFELRYHDTDRSGLGEIYRPRLVLSMRGRF